MMESCCCGSKQGGGGGGLVLLPLMSKASEGICPHTALVGQRGASRGVATGTAVLIPVNLIAARDDGVLQVQVVGPGAEGDIQSGRRGRIDVVAIRVAGNELVSQVAAAGRTGSISRPAEGRGSDGPVNR